MFENRMLLDPNIHLPDDRNSANMYARRYNTALSQFRFTLRKGKIFRFISKVMNREQFLHDLNELKPGLCVRGSFYSGIQVVPISSIVGSEGKTSDFDIDFHPLRETSRERWVNLAIAFLARIPLPPIQLIQIGEAYFVRDGHHRISVAQAFGQAAMDAEVITWKAQPPFPWQTAACCQNISYSKALT